MRMGDSPLILRLAHQHRTGIGIQVTAENIKDKITLPYKADTKAVPILRLGFPAARTPAAKIHHPVKVGAVQRMNIRIYEGVIIHLP